MTLTHNGTSGESSSSDDRTQITEKGIQLHTSRKAGSGKTTNEMVPTFYVTKGLNCAKQENEFKRKEVKLRMLEF
jgi:hypothetical protein